jgi:hypothetical protein
MMHRRQHVIAVKFIVRMIAQIEFVPCGERRTGGIPRKSRTQSRDVHVQLGYAVVVLEDPQGLRNLPRRVDPVKFLGKTAGKIIMLDVAPILLSRAGCSMLISVWGAESYGPRVTLPVRS